MIDCPEVRCYDFEERDERLRIRRLARETLGEHLRSPDVSALGRAAESLDIHKPIRPYHLDREVFRAFLSKCADALELRKGYTEAVAIFREEICDEEMVEAHARDIERFAEEHALWAVSPKDLLLMFVRHLVNEKEKT